MSEMTQRVASAIKSALSEGPPGKDPDRMESVARAAMQAMHDPTDAMIQAGDGVESAVSFVFVAADVWRAMVAEALR